MRCHHWIRRQGAGVCVATRSGLTIDFDFTEGVVTDQRSLIVEPAAGDAPVAVQSGVEVRPPLPPFTRETATQKVRLAEDGWNTRDPARVALAYSVDSRWRNRAEFANGRPEIIALLTRKWARELEYRFDQGAVGLRWCAHCRHGLRTNRATIQATGSGLTATKTGSSTSTV